VKWMMNVYGYSEDMVSACMRSFLQIIALAQPYFELGLQCTRTRWLYACPPFFWLLPILDLS